MANPTAQQVHAVITYYITAYTNVVGAKPVVNRNKARSLVTSLLMDYTSEQARDMIDFYLEHYETPRIDWFLYNYEKIDEAMSEYNKEKVSQALRRAETARRAEEWSKRWSR